MKSKNNIEKLNSTNESMPIEDGDDLFSPSEKVWENVSKKLPLKKKRRLVLPIIFGLMIVSTLLVGFLYSRQSKGATQTHEITSLENFNNSKSGESPQKDGIGQFSVEEVSLKSIESPIVKVQKKTMDSRPLFFKKDDSSAHVVKQKNESISKEIKTTDLVNESNSSEVLMADEKPVIFTPSQLSPGETVAEIPIQVSDNPIEDLTQIRVPVYVVSPVKTLSLRLSQEEKVLDLEGKFVENHVQLKRKWMYGIALAMSPLAYNSPNLKDPLEGTIKSSAYKSVAQLSVVLNYTISDHLFLSASPGIRYDRLNTDYDLSIPYDYNTETTTTNKKENYFSHSLPTDLGNIMTKMVVTRAVDSPVQHNEKINIDFGVNYKTLSISNAIGLHYAFKTKEKGLYAGIRFVPQYVISRSADVEKYQSRHTYVNGDHVDLLIVKNYKNLYLGGDVQAGYRWSLPNKNLVLDVNATYHKNFMSEGRPNDIGVGISLMKNL